MTPLQKKLLTVSIATLAATSTAQATDGIFVTVQSGVATQSGLPSPGAVGATSLETNLTPLVLRGGLGYNHDLTPYLGIGLNVGYGQYGDSVYHYPNGTSTTVKSDALEFFAQITGHIKKFDLTAKIGGAREETHVTGETGKYDVNNSHHNNPAAGVEIAYNFSPRFAAIAGYTHISGRTSEQIWQISNASASINEYLLGLRYTFAS